MKGRTVMNLISWLLMLSFLLTGCAPPAQDLVANPSAGKPQQVVTENQSTSGTENGVVPEMDRSGGHQVETEELTIESEGGSIYAVLYRPIGEETPRPTVIFSHGYGDTNRGGSRYAQTLARQGYLVCCFDFRGGGPGSQSDGSNLDMTIFTEQFDLETVLDALRQRDDVDSGNLFLLGNSQGGVVSAITAAAHPDEIAGVVLSSPAFSLFDDAKELFGSVDAIPDTYYHMLMQVGKNYFASVFDYDIFETIQNYGGDVLIFHGDRDNLVPLSYSQQAVEVLPNATLEILPGEGHMYSDAAVNKTIDRMSDFLLSHLRTSAPKTGFTTEQILDGADGAVHYSYYLPKGYDESKSYPMMVAMPGYDRMWFGEESSGSNLDWNGVQAWTRLDEDMIVVSAQLTDWGEKSARQANELTEYFLLNFAVDESRVYAAGYSAGGETMSQAVSIRPDLYAAYLHGSSQWDGTFAPIAENNVAVYIFMAENDEYYGSQKARDAYNGLHDAYRKAGLSDGQINELLLLEIPDNAYFNRLGIYNYHGGGSVLFDNENIQNWIIQKEK